LVVSDIASSKNKKLHFMKKMSEFSYIGSASNVEQAVVKLKKFSYDLVVVDISASKEANMSLLKWIRTAKINIGVILMSSENSANYIREAFGYGVCDFIIKPCSYKRFREAAIRAVGKREYLSQFKYMTQAEVDHFISLSVVGAKEYFKSKGNVDTLNIVKDVVSNKKDEKFTAKQISTKTGLSRITVRRYLEHMVENGSLKTELEYGEVGRPQKMYMNIEDQKEQ
jgi:two-component system CitB family response regulator